ncbi:MAG: hypothetical protein KBC30_10975 [Planctomycetes bacterium]|nr:hypothetical protein [Planctomycetota bacterium]HPY75575.1 LptA/OstA family protein [Planctomycetota bacterium]HQB01169.1 LptA/OstA family protein [Planctomycetota bacterium]
MKQMFYIFLSCFTILTSILYYFSGNIWVDKETSPISIVEDSEEEQPLMSIPKDDMQVDIYADHKIRGGSYVLLDEKTGETNVEIFFEEVIPLDNEKALLKNARCLYHIHKQQSTNQDFPEKFLLEAVDGRLQFDIPTKKMMFLYIDGEALIRGYNKNVPDSDIRTNSAPMKMKMTGTHWIVDLQKHTLTTNEKIYIQEWNNQGEEILQLQGHGLHCDMASKDILLNSDVTLHFYPRSLSSNQNFFLEKVTSQCTGKTKIHYGKEKQIIVRQEDNVVLFSNQGKIACDILDFMLVEKNIDGKTTISWKNFDANGNVHIEDKWKDKSQHILCNRLTGKQEDGKMNIHFHGQCKVDLQGLSAFSVIDQKTRIRFEREEQRKKIKTLHIDCQQGIHWKRVTTKNGKQEERFSLSGKVCMRQIGEKIPFIELTSDKVNILAESKEKGEQQTLTIRFLKAYKNVTVQHSQGTAKSDYLQWDQYNKNKSRILLKGIPHCILKEIDGQSTDIGMDMPSLSKTKQKKQSTKKIQEKEDIHIQSKGDMILHIRKHNKKQHLRYETSKDVLITRIQSTTQEKLGKLACQWIESRISSVKKEINGIKKEKMDLTYLHAKNSISFHFPPVQGTGEMLFFDRQVLKLENNATLETKEGTLKGNQFYYDLNTEIWEAHGKNVHFQGEEITSESSYLQYNRKKEILTLQGQPAKIFRKTEAGKEPQTLFANTIIYEQKQGIGHAQQNVEIFFEADSNNIASIAPIIKQTDPIIKQKETTIQQKDKQEKTKPSTIQHKKYNITADSLTVAINPETKELKELITTGLINAKNIPQTKDEPIETADGTKLIFRNDQGILYGEPAKIVYQNNMLTSKEIIWLNDKNELICQGPVYIELQKTNNNDMVMAFPIDRKKINNNAHNETIHIQSTGPLYFYQTKEELELHDNIIIQTTEGTLRCDKLRLVQKEQKIQRIIAHGNVKLDADKNHADADQMTWDANTEVLILVGVPYVEFTIQDIIMNSSVVLYHLKEKRFITQGSIQGKIFQKTIF